MRKIAKISKKAREKLQIQKISAIFNLKNVVTIGKKFNE